jgi:proteasome accessory factor B
MFASRPPIRRIFEIHSAITAGTHPNTATLASRFEVHRRTISRDIEYMRDQLRAPIEYNPARRGFYYTEPNYSLPIIQMTEGEVFALFLAEKVLQQYRGTPYEGLLKSAFAKLVRNLPDEISVDLQEAVHAFSFDLRMTPPFDPEIFNALVEAVRRRPRFASTIGVRGAARRASGLLTPTTWRTSAGDGISSASATCATN